jgi:hypothetical protein
MNRFNNDRGVTMVEFAFSAVVFISLIFVSFNYGLAFLRSGLVTKAITNGGRKAALQLGVETCDQFQYSACMTIKQSVDQIGSLTQPIEVSILRRVDDDARCDLRIETQTAGSDVSMRHLQSFPIEDSLFCMKLGPCGPRICGNED